MFASTLGRARLFIPMNSSSAKIRESVARLLRQPIHGFGCVAHKRIYSQWLQRFCSYPRKKCHGNYTPASLQADTNGLVQQARSKRFNKTSKASAISTTESAASRGAKSHSNQTLKSYICANSQQKSHLSRIKCQMTKYDKGLYNLYNINKCAASMRRA